MTRGHEIRLRGPWQIRSHSSDGKLLAEASINLTKVASPQLSSTILNALARRIVFRRQFNRPEGLGEHENVHLCCKFKLAPCELVLNDEPLNLSKPMKDAIGDFETPMELVKGGNQLEFSYSHSRAEELQSIWPFENVRLRITG